MPVYVAGCFDLSAARSVKARRSNASPWSKSLVPELIIQAKEDSSLDTIEALIKKEMPFLDTAAVEARLSHWAPSFPWSCPCCDYKVAYHGGWSRT